MTVQADLDHTAKVNDALVEITTDVADVLDGYAAMIERAEKDLKPHIQRLRSMHATHLVALKAQLSIIGGNPDAAGSAMGYVHQAVAAVRDWVGKLDASALPQIVDGEEMIVESYTDAMRSIEAGTRVHQLLDEQRHDLRAQIAILRA